MRLTPIAALALFATACTAAPVATSFTPVSTTTTSTSTTSTTVADTTTTSAAEQEIVWSETEAERHVTNYLAALAAGAYEQAAWPIENNGLEVEGQSTSETPGEALARLCAPDLCTGPYTVEADGPGLRDPQTALASSLVTVTHVDSGDQVKMRLATFEGQMVITDLPPLFSRDAPATLVEQLFKGDLPERIVVQRFDAFEIWEDGESRWVTNWWAEDAQQVEADLVALIDGLVALDDPQTTLGADCFPRLMTDDEVLVLEQCGDIWSYYEAYTADPRPTPIEFSPGQDGETVFFVERAGTVVTGTGDAEGNITSMESDGVDLLDDDYASLATLSVDGTLIAYVDHSDPAALSHFWSPVVVVRDVATGDEVGRWTLDDPVLTLEFSRDWVLAAEIDAEATGGLYLEHDALSAIYVPNGLVTTIETPVRVFLPS